MNNSLRSQDWKTLITNPGLILVALGYFVDIFDITLFGMVRVPSLKSLGIPLEEQLPLGQYLINAQMLGMLCGGIFWGVLGDKIGRLKTLFGSIFLYSLANLLNAFVQDVETYAVLRFISGVGLAGELGVGVTLVSETLPVHLRGLGTALIAGIGVCGALVGGILVELVDWRICYIVGGSLGFVLLLLRLNVKESGLFLKHKASASKSVGLIFVQSLFRPDVLRRFVLCVLVGIPIWYIAGILMTLSSEVAKALGVIGEVTPSRSITISYLGLAVGDFLSGMLSHYWQSRRKVIFVFQAFTLVILSLFFMTTKGLGPVYFYTLCFLIGVGVGFWALFVVLGAEQFGTDVRSTFATSVPNFVRGSLILQNFVLSKLLLSYSLISSALILGAGVFGLSILATYLLRESFHQDLDFKEG
jgi:putative MFS transporter